MRPKVPSLTTSPEEAYPSCEILLWQIGQWRCDYWRPAGTWRGSSLRLFREARLVRTFAFGSHASEKASAWRVAVGQEPDRDPR